MGRPKGKELTVEAVNQRLRAAKIGVAVEAIGKGEYLYLRTTLPPKPNDPQHKKPFSQRISLGIRANHFGLEVAEARAMELRSQLTWGRFDWEEWADVGEPELSAGQWIEKYKAHLMNEPRYKRSRDPEKKWKNEAWHCGLSALRPNEPVTEENCLQSLLRKKEGSRQRQLTAQALTRFAEFCGVEVELNHLGRGYSLDKVRRYVPSNQEVLEVWEKIPKESRWRAFYALAAVYGLRPYEVFLGKVATIDIEGEPLTVFDLQDVAVNSDEIDPEELGEDSDRMFLKNDRSSRLVAPIPKEWVEYFGIRPNMDLPKVTKNFGDAATKRFRAHGIPFPSYALRHRYSLAGNTTEGLGVAVTSAFLGHSPAVNQRIYQRHLDSDWALEAYAKKQNVDSDVSQS